MGRFVVCAVLFVFTTSAAAQGPQLVVSNLVQGQVASLEVAGAISGSQIVYVASLAGLGPGSCFPSAGFCLGVQDPFALLGVLVADTNGAASYDILIPQTVPLIEVATQAVQFTSVLGIGTFQTSNADSTTIAPLSSLSDQFVGSTLDPSWQVLHPNRVNIQVSGGALHLTPLTVAPEIWFEDGEAGFIYKDLTGNFTLTAGVTVGDPLNPGAPPPTEYRFGGLLVRDPASSTGHRNSAHVVMGGGSLQTPVAVEDKTTFDSQSDFVLYPVGTTSGELRITRQGASISLWHRPTPMDSWTLLRTHSHPEFPATVQVGMMTYSFPSPPSVVASFDWITFAP